MNLKNYVKSIENFPKEGIIFRDITPLMQDGKAYKETINRLVEFAKFFTTSLSVGSNL